LRDISVLSAVESMICDIALYKFSEDIDTDHVFFGPMAKL